MAALLEVRDAPRGHQGSDRGPDPRSQVRAALQPVESAPVAMSYSGLPERQLLHVGEWRDGFADDLDGPYDTEAAPKMAKVEGLSAGMLRGVRVGGRVERGRLACGPIWGVVSERAPVKFICDCGNS